MISLKNISKCFGDKKALDRVNLNIDKGLVIGILGPNGAGKTTLMRIITGFFQPSEGDIKWMEKETDLMSVEYKRKIGYLPENNPLFGSMTTGEYLKFVAEIKNPNKDNKDDIRKRIEECGLVNVIGQKIETLSKGYKQRVGLAAAILGDPKVLVLDEPTSGLDPNQIIEIRELIKKIAKKKTVLLSTHILPEAKAICDRIIIINQGKIVLDDETSKIKNLEKKFVELTI